MYGIVVRKSVKIKDKRVQITVSRLLCLLYLSLPVLCCWDIVLQQAGSIYPAKNRSLPVECGSAAPDKKKKIQKPPKLNAQAVTTMVAGAPPIGSHTRGPRMAPPPPRGGEPSHRSHEPRSIALKYEVSLPLQAPFRFCQTSPKFGFQVRFSPLPFPSFPCINANHCPLPSTPSLADETSRARVKRVQGSR